MSDVIETAVVGEAKSFLLSKTIWANLIGFGATWLGAHHLPISPAEQVDVLTGVMAVVNILLRLVTTRPVTLSLPGASGAGTNAQGAPAGTTPPVSKTLGVVLLIGLLVPGLSGCAGQTPAQQVYDASELYAVALGAADAYVALPSCVAGGPVVCKTPAVVAQLQAASTKVAAALQLANAALAANQDPSSALSDFYAALPALQTLIGALPKGMTTSKVYLPKRRDMFFVADVIDHGLTFSQRGYYAAAGQIK